MIIPPIVSLLTRKAVPTGVDEKFSCYDEKKMVDVTDSLGK